MLPGVSSDPIPGVSLALQEGAGMPNAWEMKAVASSCPHGLAEHSLGAEVACMQPRGDTAYSL